MIVLCKECGLEPVKPGKRLGPLCVDRKRIDRQRLQNERRVAARGRRGKPKTCDNCGDLGHTPKTCTFQPGPGRRACLRCRDDALPGEPHCLAHKRTLEENEREGWMKE